MELNYPPNKSIIMETDQWDYVKLGRDVVALPIIIRKNSITSIPIIP